MYASPAALRMVIGSGRRSARASAWSQFLEIAGHAIKAEVVIVQITGHT